jgi:AraC-like DNA-binding protein
LTLVVTEKLLTKQMSCYYTAKPPTRLLNRVIKNFFIMGSDQTIASTEYLLPDGLPSFFYLQTKEILVSRFGKRSIDMQSGFYVGYSNMPVEFDHQQFKIVGGSVYPVYFKLIFGQSPQDLINKFSTLETTDALKRISTLLNSTEIHLLKAKGLFEKYISNQLNKHSLSHDMRIACEKLMQHPHHSLTVEKLAEELGYSTRYLNSRFKESFGMPPKKFIKLVRFNIARKCIYEGEGNRNLTSIAEEAGYHDQSHFIRDFKSICGKTPKEILDNSDWLANKFLLF